MGLNVGPAPEFPVRPPKKQTDCLGRKCADCGALESCTLGKMSTMEYNELSDLPRYVPTYVPIYETSVLVDPRRFDPETLQEKDLREAREELDALFPTLPAVREVFDPFEAILDSFRIMVLFILKVLQFVFKERKRKERHSSWTSSTGPR